MAFVSPPEFFRWQDRSDFAGSRVKNEIIELVLADHPAQFPDRSPLPYFLSVPFKRTVRKVRPCCVGVKRYVGVLRGTCHRLTLRGDIGQNPPMRKVVKVSTYVTTSQLEALRKISAETQLPQSVLWRNALNMLIEHYARKKKRRS